VSRELRRLIAGAGTASILLASAITTNATTASPPADPGVGNVPQKLQSDGAYAVTVNFYDRRLACPARGTADAAHAGLALDGTNPNYTGALPPYSAANYCITAAVQLYSATLAPFGNNVRLTQNIWDPQLNAPDRSCPCNQDDTFLGDYFGNEISGSTDFASFVSTYDDGTNPHHYQQQVVATI
jgi:hypothetical protein